MTEVLWICIPDGEIAGVAAQIEGGGNCEEGWVGAVRGAGCGPGAGSGDDAELLRERVAQSFSGAFARGGTATVELHLLALLEHRILHEVYLALARNAFTSLPVGNWAELG